MKYYAVKNGRVNGIYTDWDSCKEQVIGFEGAIYKSFSTKEEAEAYLTGGQIKEENYNRPTAYVDGSFNINTNEYSFGAILFVNGQKLIFKKKFEADKYSTFRNVAGEVRGASFIINYALKQGIKELDLFYDYQGIESWFTQEWKANNELTINYQKFANDVKDKIKVSFKKVKSHTGVKYNEEVDSLAKEALGI
ncbi:MAG: ribonuclease H family protein [Acholeplasmatales bacterium]|nr:ribonuclease H family protein [Acholeplasmatales bacterium]